MRYLFLIALFSFSMMASAQKAPQEPAYKRFPTVPPFELMQPDSSILTKAILKKQPTIIMYFSPSCDHCIHQIKEMEKRWKDFAPYQLVMATYQPMEELTEFIEQYHMKDHANIKLGRDTKFMLPGFFVIKALPFFALYDKKGSFITTFEGNVSVDKILDSLKRK